MPTTSSSCNISTVANRQSTKSGQLLWLSRQAQMIWPNCLTLTQTQFCKRQHKFISLPPPSVRNLTPPLSSLTLFSPERRISPLTLTHRQPSTKFNKIIKNFCDGRSIIYNKLHGFANYCINNIEYPRPVHSWSHDGIHCNKASMAHYKRRVAHSILDNTYRLYL